MTDVIKLMYSIVLLLLLFDIYNMRLEGLDYEKLPDRSDDDDDDDDDDDLGDIFDFWTGSADYYSDAGELEQLGDNSDLGQSGSEPDSDAIFMVIWQSDSEYKRANGAGDKLPGDSGT